MYSAISQTADYMQNLNFSLSTNPAFAGTSHDLRLFAGYRTKFVSLSNPFVNYYVSADLEIDKIKSGVGIQLFREESGETAFTSHQASVIYSKTFTISKKARFKLAADIGVLFYGLDAGGITTQNMIEEGHGFIYPIDEPIESFSKAYFNVSAGALFYSNSFSAGLSLKQLSEPGRVEHEDTVRNIYPLSANLHLSFLFKAGNVDILPNLLIRKQRLAGKGCIGLIVRPKPLIVGVAFNTSEVSGAESFSTLIGFMQKKYKFAYNCDWSLNSATGQLPDIHEISITVYPGSDKKKPSAVSCPGAY